MESAWFNIFDIDLICYAWLSSVASACTRTQMLEGICGVGGGLTEVINIIMFSSKGL